LVRFHVDTIPWRREGVKTFSLARREFSFNTATPDEICGPIPANTSKIDPDIVIC
jgi:hypothetical protein